MPATMRRTRDVASSIALSLFLAPTLLSCGGGGGGDFANPPPPQLGIDVQTALVSGTLDLNGGSFPGSVYESGIVHARDAEGNLTFLGYSYNGEYERRVVQGTYQPTYERNAGGALVPANELTPFGAPFTWHADTTTPFDVLMAQVDATFTLNGAAFPESVYESAYLELWPHAGGDRVVLGTTDNGAGSAHVIPGVYDLVYARKAGGTVVPVNEHAVLQAGLVIGGDLSLPIDVTSTSFLLVPVLDGIAFPVSATQSGRFSLRNKTTGDTAALFSTEYGSLNRIVIPGTYDLVYTHLTGGDVPQNSAAVVATGIPVDAAHPTLTVNVHSSLVTPQPTLDGGAFSGGAATFFLRGAEDDTVFFTTTDIAAMPVRVVRGAYDVTYRHLFGTGVPLNANARVLVGASIVADTILPVPVASALVTPSFTHDGGSFPAGGANTAAFHARGEVPDDVFLLGLSNAVPQPVKLIQGTYDVFYVHVSGAAIPQNTHALVAGGVVLAGPQALAVDVTSTLVQPVFTFDGVAAGHSAYLWSEFFLREPSGETFPIGDTIHDGESVRVIPGTYDVVYEWRAGDGTFVLPANTHAKVATVTIDD